MSLMQIEIVAFGTYSDMPYVLMSVAIVAKKKCFMLKEQAKKSGSICISEIVNISGSQTKR